MISYVPWASVATFIGTAFIVWLILVVEDYRRDLDRSREITLEAWRGRPLWEKLIGTVAWILERQQ